MMDDEYGDREEGRAVTRSEENRPVMSSEAGPSSATARSVMDLDGADLDTALRAAMDADWKGEVGPKLQPAHAAHPESHSMSMGYLTLPESVVGSVMSAMDGGVSDPGDLSIPLVGPFDGQ